MIGSLAASFVGTSCWLFVAYVSVTCVAFLGFCRFFFVFRRRSSKTRSVAAAASQAAQTLAFFHPYANSGGGGERVLWLAVKALIETKQRVRIVIFTGDTDSSEAILKRTRERFGVSFDDEESAASRPVFVRLKHRRWIEAASWPRFTMIGQSIGSMVLAVEALLAFTPDVFVDTTGFAFSFPVAWLLAGCKVGAYVHYPTISTDMLKQVVEKRPTYNNDSTISSSGWRTKAKLAYYHFFALLYRLVGRCSHVVMANSSWTGGHIRSLWGKGTVVYPPCDVSTFTAFPLNNRARVVVSVSQYRPEKDQQLQIRALHALHAASPECKDVSLVLIGSCRHADDHQIADGLESLAASLGLAPSADQDGNEHSGTVRVLRNLPYAELKQWLARATAGIHTMWNEHFGIGVVEMQAAGCITVAHDSAGPQMDIIVPAARGAQSLDQQTDVTGFLAASVDEYTAALANVFTLENDVLRRIQLNGRAACERFSEEVFKRKFIQALQPILPS